MAVVLSSGTNILRLHSPVIGVAYVRTANYSSEGNPFNLASLKRGTGGRSSFNGIVATVFGASGFVGRYVCNRLGKIGTQMILPYRGDHYDVLRLKLCGDLGQILFQPYYLRNEEDLDKAVKYSNVVVNLVGRDWETKNFKFEDVHVKGARALARAAKKAGVKKFIHLSALNAEEKPTPILKRNGSQFLASKWRGEKAVLEEFPEATIIRPADVYGQEDRFLNYYVHHWRRMTVTNMPLWKKGECTIKQPVFVSDLAAGIVNAIKDPDSAGKIYQAVGPKRYYLSELVDWFYRVVKRDEEWGYKRVDIRWHPLFQLKVTLTSKLPGFPVAHMHWERIERESVTDNVVQGMPTLEDLGVKLTSMEDQVPWELMPYTYGIYHDRDLEEFGVRPAPPKVVS